MSTATYTQANGILWLQNHIHERYLCGLDAEFVECGFVWCLVLLTFYIYIYIYFYNPNFFLFVSLVY